jgi:LysM repeat protein
MYQVALPEIGYQEGPNNQNKYASVVGVANNEAWCTTFASWLFKSSGYQSLCKMSNYSVDQYNWFNGKGRASGYPAVGATVYFGPGGENHTGWVYAYDANYIYTIEGNYNNEVNFHKRARRSSMGEDDPSIGGVFMYGYPAFAEGIVTADPNHTVSGSVYAAAASVNTTTAPPPSGSGTTYTVVSGDTLSGIASALNVTLADLLAANPQITDPNVIQVGDVINIPAGGTTTPPPPAVRKSVVTTAGQTYAAVASAAGVSLADLLAWNGVAPATGTKLWTEAPLSDPPPPPSSTDPDGWVNSVAINDKTAVQFTRYTSGGTVASWIAAACKARGIVTAAAVANWTKGYTTAIARESSGDANACNRNDSNNVTPAGYSQVRDYGNGYPGGNLNGALTNYQCSRGVAQCIPQTFAAYHCPGTSALIYDPVANIAASMGYVRSVYGVSLDGHDLASKVQQFDPNRSPKGY